MTRWIAFVLSLSLSYRSAAQDAAFLLSRGAQLEAAFREEEALPVYENAATLQPRNIVALIHCSDLLCRVGHRLKDRDKTIAYFRSAYTYAQRAYRVDSTNSDANVVMAFSLARLALDQNGKERVVSANEIRRYAEQAIHDDPGNFKALVLWVPAGVFSFGVYQQPGEKQGLAAQFYAELFRARPGLSPGGAERPGGRAADADGKAAR